MLSIVRHCSRPPPLCCACLGYRLRLRASVLEMKEHPAKTQLILLCLLIIILTQFMIMRVFQLETRAMTLPSSATGDPAGARNGHHPFFPRKDEDRCRIIAGLLR